MNKIEEIQDIFETNGINDGIIYAKAQMPPFLKQPSKPNLAMKHNSVELAEYVKKFELWEAELEKYKILVKENYIKEKEIEQAIEKGIKSNLGFYNIVPEKYQDKVWSLAWIDGHSDGWHEVSNRLDTLINIFDI